MTDQPDAKSFRDAMRAFVGNCSVLTCGEGEKATGLIVTSTISPSAEPPRLLACVNRSASSWQVLKDTGRFGWSSLGAAHLKRRQTRFLASLCRRFENIGCGYDSGLRASRRT